MHSVADENELRFSYLTASASRGPQGRDSKGGPDDGTGRLFPVMKPLMPAVFLLQSPCTGVSTVHS